MSLPDLEFCDATGEDFANPFLRDMSESHVDEFW